MFVKNFITFENIYNVILKNNFNKKIYFKVIELF